MNVLFLTPGINLAGVKGSQSTGFAIVVEQLARLMGQGHRVTVCASCLKTVTRKESGYTVTAYGWGEIVNNVRFTDLVKGVRYAISAKDVGFRTRLNLLRYFASIGYIDSVIESVKPDVVHIHGLLWSDLPFILSCVRNKVPFVLTLHGLYSLSDSVKLTPFEKRLEMPAIRLFRDSVTVVSSGMKARTAEDVKVVLSSQPELKIKSKSVRKKQIVFAGNIMERKNQAQLVRALEYIAPQTREGLKVIFAGADYMDGALQKMASSSICEFTGAISREKVFEILAESHCTALLSVDEGFGLSMIEGYSMGLATMCFDDIDAIEDIYYPGCTLLIQSRDDRAVAAAIDEMFAREWDRERIIEFSKKFSAENTFAGYDSAYKLAHVRVAESEFDVFLEEYFNG